MSKFDYRSLSSQKRRKFLDELADIVVTLKKKDEARFFLERLLTESEVVMLKRRLDVAKMLVGGLTYEQIQRKLKVGMSTIHSIDRWLTDAAYEYQQIRDEQRKAAREKKLNTRADVRRQRASVVSAMPDELQRIIRGDSRMILFRLLLGDF